MKPDIDDDRLTADALRRILAADSGSAVDVVLDHSGRARIIFFQTSEMRRVFKPGFVAGREIREKPGKIEIKLTALKRPGIC